MWQLPDSTYSDPLNQWCTIYSISQELLVLFHVWFVWYIPISLRWRHNGRYSVSNHQPHEYLLNRLFRRRSKKTSKLCVPGLCAGNSSVTGEIPAQMASNAENVSIWWRHHVYSYPQESYWHWSTRRISAMPVKHSWSLWLTQLPWTKWPPFHSRYIQMHFREWKVLYFE